MAALRLIDALPDFGAPAAPAPGTPRAPAPPSPAPQPPQVDVDAIVRAEVERAEQALAMRLAVEHEAALLAERRTHAEEIEALSHRLGEDAATAIATRLTELERGVGEHVSATVARILGGVLADDLRRRSIESLARSIDAALRDADSLRIEVRGPRSLFEGLSQALAGRAANLHHIETDGFDLSVAIDGAVFETRLGEWSGVLSEILE
ncbi:hypothetical protein RB623_06630 [Mesorhizobium sp. LHD-90]|uniref:hypothetical protein n=1 Tax=Mesorhizobium sp. LHD-90 TaxID=3071414 RepID=UPI0027E1F32E|nr:hypothetical protein [Mesorhizobium sp. LHD-90]MDQ6433725.1 hypothetical protein [Mesorhizobium sp. LHD-90]